MDARADFACTAKLAKVVKQPVADVHRAADTKVRKQIAFDYARSRAVMGSHQVGVARKARAVRTFGKQLEARA